MISQDAAPTDIVVCVRDGMSYVEQCLGSLERHTHGRYRLIVVDDGSSRQSRASLEQLVHAYPECIVIRNDSPLGYTKAANRGLRLSTADFVVLLNSDTIVTAYWLDRLRECAHSSPRIGIVGPLSNAAGYQSVPEIFGDNDGWSDNSFPPGWEVNAVAEAVATIAPREFPRVPWINGFCLAVKRRVINTIGYFDDVAFPEAYAEEYDYCLRAIDAGFQLAVADHAYVFHALSRSYSNKRRRTALKRAGTAALIRKHGNRRVSESLAWLKDEPTLAMIRQRLAACLSETSPPAVLSFSVPEDTCR